MSSLRRLHATVAIVCVIGAAGCTSAASESTVAGATTTVPNDDQPSTTPPPVSTSTTQPPLSTSAPTTATTSGGTVAPPTTALPTPTTLQPSPLTHVAVTRLCVLGSWDGSQWVESPKWLGGEAPVELPDLEAAAFSVATLTGTSNAVAGRQYEVGFDDFQWGLELDPLLDWESGVGVSGALDLVPRPVRELPVGTVDYAADTRQVLAGLGVSSAPVEVTRAMVVDLDGDGVDEIVYTAEHPDMRPGALEREGLFPVGHYSVAIVRHIAGTSVESLLLYHSVATEPGSYLGFAELNSFADLNGDGTMEVVVGTSYWEGSFDLAFEYDPAESELEPVLFCGRGA